MILLLLLSESRDRGLSWETFFVSPYT